MFERYTERARRALFFARYEATQVGSASIETEHLLLGLAREGHGPTMRILARAHLSLESLRQELATRFPEKALTSIEIPFSTETKRVLAFAAEEADRLRHHDIGTEHLLMGILREEGSVAAATLARHGLRLAGVRDQTLEIRNEPGTPERGPDGRPDLPPSYEVRVSPTRRKDHEGTASTRGPTWWTFEGFDLRAVLSEVCGIPATRIESPASIDDAGRHDYAVVLPTEENQSTMNRLMREGIERHFHVRITRVTRVSDVYVLTAPTGAITAKKTSEFSVGGTISMSFDWTASAPGTEPPSEEELRKRFLERFRAVTGAAKGARALISGISGTSAMEPFCAMLERGLDRPVIDETNLTGTYELNVRVDAENAGGFLQALSDQLGLVATPDRRDVTILVVREH
jgi:uncharacterized protein (TIGR03435 family)